jgi:hypothetical protein
VFSDSSSGSGSGGSGGSGPGPAAGSTPIFACRQLQRWGDDLLYRELPEPPASGPQPPWTGLCRPSWSSGNDERPPCGAQPQVCPPFASQFPCPSPIV